MILLCFWIFVPLSAWLGAWRFMRSLAPGQTHQSVRLSHEGLQQEDGQAFGRNSWETVLSAHETNEAFYLRAAGPLLRFIPKRAFATQDELALARRLIREHLGSRAHLR